LPFDRSGVDLTAHVIRALLAVYGCDVQYATQGERRKVGEAIARGLAFVEARQRSSGGWSPLWFGNQDAAEEENLVYGTAKVLLAYEAAHRGASPPAQRGRAYLLASQNADGGWGGGPAMRAGHVARGQTSWTSSVEETALAVEALLAFPDSQEGSREALHRGVAWLCRAVENTMLFDSAPIGLYFAKLWYYERLYPLVFTVAALGKARRRLAP
jgi:squalene-hopene/tetraprenyl-beta-curcumene cyclase